MVIDRKEKPILFNAEMIQAILKNRKTQTRRVIKGLSANYRDAFEPGRADPVEYNGRWFLPTHRGLKRFYCNPGDLLWVRETWQYCPECGRTNWRASTGNKSTCPHCDVLLGKWKPSIHMFRKDSRIMLEVTAVRVERLRDISEADAIAEGVSPVFTHDEIHNPKYRAELDLRPMPYRNYLWHGRVGNGITVKQADGWPCQFSSYKLAYSSFSSLWESINAKRGYSWESNPFVWVVEFKLTKGGDDANEIMK